MREMNQAKCPKCQEKKAEKDKMYQALLKASVFIEQCLIGKKLEIPALA